MDAHDAISFHKPKILQGNSKQLLSVNRNGNIVRDIFKKFKRGEIDIRKAPDIEFICEDGIDAEGLTKEFFSLLMDALKSGTGGYTLFEGAEGHLLPVISQEYVQSKYFKYVGQLIAMSTLHAGFGMVGMSKALAVYMITDDLMAASCHLDVNDISDYGMQDILSQVLK